MIKLYLLGAPYLRREDGETPHAVPLQPKLLALLAYLSRVPAGYARRDTLIALFWPTLDEHHARNALSQAVYRLRQAVGKETVVSRGVEELNLSPTALWCDATAFEQALQDDRLADALDLYQGPLLDGLHVGEAPDFEHWLEVERERLRQRACEAAAALADRAETEGNLTGAVRWLRRRLTLAPDDEAALRRLMTMLNQAGDRPGAVHAYEAFARRLAHELDLTPSPETQALLSRLRVPAQGTAAYSPREGSSIAVLPFANFSQDPEQEYFCDGMTEEIIATLAQIPGLRVAARTSLSAFKGQAVDVRALALKLGVATILEGSVRRADHRLRITAQLIDAEGYHLWSEQYDRPLRDVFTIQEEIAQSIARALKVELLERADEGSLAHATENLEAHALYLRGLFHRHKRTPPHLRKACEYFEQAAALDPRYAQAHAALAFTRAISGHFHYDLMAPARAYPLARSAAMNALSLNDRLPEGYTTLGVLHTYYEWDWEKAEQAFRQALHLDPDNPYTLANYAIVGVRPGQIEQFIAFTQRCEELDPLWINAKAQVGVALYCARRYDEARERLRQTQEMEPGFYISPLYLGDVCRGLNELEEAEASYRRVLELVGRQPVILGRLGMLYALRGRTDEAIQMLNELKAMRQTRHVLPSYVADLHLTLGEYDKGFAWMDKACIERDTRLVTLHVSPFYDPVRSDPRFQRLLERVGLAES